jgi:hypothetical protein
MKIEVGQIWQVHTDNFVVSSSNSKRQTIDGIEYNEFPL